MMEKREIRYSGHVQGVGFRYTTRHIAQGYDVVGYVKNLPDGRVELVVEGESKEVAAFLAEVDRQLGRYIRDTKQDRAPATGHFGDFTIAY